VLQERVQRYGATEFSVLSSRFGVARDLRQVGRHEDALPVSLRRAGYYEEARDIAEDTYRRYVAYAGKEHPATLSMATNPMCELRMKDLARAQALGEATVAAWTKAVGADNPATLNARGNLAIILRARDDPAAALEMNQATLASFQRRYSYDHPDALLGVGAMEQACHGRGVPDCEKPQFSPLA
jgi:hypothetical protein